MTIEPVCSFIVNNGVNNLDLGETRKTLEIGTETARIETMKAVLASLSSGHSALGPALLMTIIRFVMPNQKNKLLKKLVLLFFELVPKVDSDGKLLSEMILLCNALRNDLQHPNEYVRGVTLRFLARIREAEILEPLLPSVREHRHAYVRRNAIFAMFSIYQCNECLVPDAPEAIQNLLSVETDASCQRNAFLMLTHTDPARAGEFFSSLGEKIATLDPLLQLSIIEFIRSDSARCQENLSRNVRCTVTLLQSLSTVVKFEAATALMQLSSSPVAVKAIASCYIDLAAKETDNNAKLMVLDRFRELQIAQASIVNEIIIDVVRVLNASDLAVRQKALEILLIGINVRHVSELTSFLIRELGKLQDYDQAEEYKRSLLAAIDSCASRFPLVAPLALDCFIGLLNNANNAAISDAIRYAKEILERVPSLCSDAVDRLIEILTKNLSDSKASASLLWILGEFCTTPESINQAFDSIMAGLGPLPLVESEEAIRHTGNCPDEDSVNCNQTTVLKPSNSSRRINADGTYVTETALTTGNREDRKLGNFPLREMILRGEYGVAVALSGTLTKMILHSEPSKLAFRKAQGMLTLTSVLRVGLSQLVPTQIDKDSYDRIMLSLRLLAKPSSNLEEAFAKECRKAFDSHLKHVDMGKSQDKHSKNVKVTKVDDGLHFRLAKAGKTLKISILPDEWERDVQLAVGVKSSEMAELVSSLSKVVQLTGFSDEIYAETYVTVSHSDVILDILLVNQMEETLQNVTVDLSTSGDLKVNEKPLPMTLSPMGFAIAKASLKVKSTDNGFIFGSISYGTTDIQTIVLSTIPIDVCEYIRPRSTSNAEFRTIWTTLEWENKINVNTIPDSNLEQVMESILTGAKLMCLTPGYGISESGDYLAANMYAVSLFGEEILANICLERTLEGVSGHLRLRSKTQGIAIALGDRITEIVGKLARVNQRRSLM